MRNPHLMKIGIELVHILGSECEFNEEFIGFLSQK